MSDTDMELIERYTRQHTEDPFAELVRRHVDLVHSAALRQVRSSQLAEEVAQSTFIKLARLAPQLAPDTVLTAWLYQVTRREAIDVVRREARRQLREQIATEMYAINAADADWTHIEPLLDDAISALDEADRAAVLLRYFENKSLREVGAMLGTSDDTAQKRVSRAVDRLRDFFSKRNITIGAGGLVVLISANAVQSAPVGLAVTISAAPLAGTASTTSTIIAATTKTIAMTTLQKTLVTTTVAVLAGAGIYEARQAAQLRDRAQTLQQQQAPLTEQFQQLQNSFADATNRLINLLAENSRLESSSDQTELLKLRGEVSRLRTQTQENNSNTRIGKVVEPSYLGKTLTAWLEESKNLPLVVASDTPEDRRRKSAALQETYDAVQYIGSNAVPTLLQWVANNTNGFGYILAAGCIQKLGPDAKVAVPGLIDILNGDNQQARYSAFNVLQRIGSAADESLPVILDHIQHDSSQSMRSFAVTTLANNGIGSTAPDTVVPILMECLAPANETIDRPDTLRALAGLGANAKMAVPVILPYLEDANQDVRIAATNALLKIAPSALNH